MGNEARDLRENFMIGAAPLHKINIFSFIFKERTAHEKY